MSNQPQFQRPPTEQTVKQNNWNTHAFGFNPRNIVETLAANFIKAFSFISGWDYDNEIWRSVGVDTSGNVKTTNGTQNNLAPAITTVSLTNASQVILPFNSQRRAFAIYNEGSNGDTTKSLLISYPNPVASSYLTLPAGCYYIDDTWQGDVIALLDSPGSLNVTVIEYY